MTSFSQQIHLRAMRVHAMHSLGACPPTFFFRSGR